MKIKIVKNKYLNALFLLMLLSAIIHIAILFVFAITSESAHPLNYFNILNLNYFFPGFLNSVQGDIISTFFVLALYIIILNLNGRDEARG